MGKVLRGPFFFQPLLPSHGRFAAKWNVLPRKKHILAYGFTLSITSAAGARMAPANAKTQRQRTIRKPLACVPQYVTRQQPAQVPRTRHTMQRGNSTLTMAKFSLGSFACAAGSDGQRRDTFLLMRHWLGCK